MDLSKVVSKVSEGTWCDIYMPDGQTLLFQFKMLSRDSDECKIALAKNREKARNRRGKVNTKAEEDENKDVVISCISAWRDPDKAVIDPKTKNPDLDNLKEVIYDGGKELVCNYLNKKRILTDYGFVLRQADSYIVDDNSFFSTAEPS